MGWFNLPFVPLTTLETSDPISPRTLPTVLTSPPRSPVEHTELQSHPSIASVLSSARLDGVLTCVDVVVVGSSVAESVEVEDSVDESESVEVGVIE